MNILISGANQGIGYYMVKELLKQGDNIIILDLEINALLELGNQYPNKILPLVCDVRDNKKIRDSIKLGYTQYGNIDIVIHNACRCTFQSMEEAEYSVYEDILDINYFGALRLTKNAIPYMKKGKIIFVSSGVGVTGFHNISPYASSKGAIEALAKCLRIEYHEQGISFQLMHPPLTKTKSASPLPIPKEFLVDPEKVGRGLAKRLNKNGFYICHSFIQLIQMKICYHFPLSMGAMMSKMTKRAEKRNDF